MNSSKIDEFLHKMIEPDQCHVIGAIPRDLLSYQNVARYPACAIVNTDPSSKPGQHWVAFYFFTPLDYEFFDSFGLHPSYYGFDPLWQSPSRWTHADLQPDLATSCGQFCLYYLHQKSLGFPIATILDSFSRIDLKFNDKLVRKYVQKFTNLPQFSHSFNLPPYHSQKSIRKFEVSRDAFKGWND